MANRSAAKAEGNSASLHLRQRAESLSARLPPLLVAAERVASTVAQGVHGRRRVGLGETFWQFRRYEQGDSPQSIDWRQSGKSQAVFVRENEWEAAQSVWLWPDRSPSMVWRSSASLPTKRDRAELLVIATAVLLVRGGERVGMLNSGRRPDHGRHALERMAIALSNPASGDPAIRVDHQGLPRPEPLPRHAQVVLVGDFLSPLDEVRRTLTGLAGRGVRGHLLQVLDPAEEILPFDGRVEFAGMEGEDNLLVPRVESIRQAYQERLSAHRAGLADLARAAGWSFATHRTDRAPQTALLALWGALSQEAVSAAPTASGASA